PRSLAAVWQTSINELGPHASRLLGRLSWFSPDPIPLWLFDVRVNKKGSREERRALTELVSYSLVKLDRGSEYFSLHRIVQDVTRRHMLSAHQRTATLTDSITWLV